MEDLEVDGVTKSFGGVCALNDVHFTASKASVHGLIGPNGAGKSTLLNVISGFISQDRGKIMWNGVDISNLSPLERVRRGIVRTFQEPSPFKRLNVIENLLVGFHIKARSGLVSTLLSVGPLINEERYLRGKAEQILAKVGLANRANVMSNDLSFGEMRFLEVARAIATDAELILLDEPATGMNAEEIRTLARVIQELAAEGKCIVLIDHDMRFVFDVCDEITVMDAGSVIARGTPSEIANDTKVRSAYLGT
jgi:branched-chain amino acid transport system ATP-binding protein